MVLFIDWRLELIVFLIGALTLSFIFLNRIYTYWDRNGFKTLPDFIYIVGHLKYKFKRMAFADSVMNCYKATNEPFVGIYVLFRATLFVRDLELIRTILVKDFSYFSDRGISYAEHDALANNLFTMPGPKWKKLRNKWTPTLTSGKLKAMFFTLIECGSTLQNHLNKLAVSHELLDVKDISTSHAINVIASVAFGIDVDTINDQNNEFRICGRSIVRPSIWEEIKRVLTIGAPKLLTTLKLKLFNTDIEEFIMSVVKQNLEYREKNNVIRKDFFQLLIQLRNTGTVQLDNEWETEIKTDESQKAMTLNEMAAQVFVFFLAGFETTSSTLTFCLYELAKNLDIQQRVHVEIDRVLARHNDQITYESITEMAFLESCIDEALRMYPILPVLMRSCNKDYQIPGTDKIIEKGTELYIPVYPLQRDEKYYDEPNKFNPDRFNEENPAGRDQLNQPYLPFGDGPRNCVGMRLGKLQTKVGLIMMLQKFTYELDDSLKNREIQFDPKIFSITPLGVINLKVYKR